jgi:hypothetical protein
MILSRRAVIIGAASMVATPELCWAGRVHHNSGNSGDTILNSYRVPGCLDSSPSFAPIVVPLRAVETGRSAGSIS